MKKNFNYIYTLVISILLFSSCSFLDVEPNIISQETFYKTQDEVNYGLYGVYGAMNNEEFYGNFYSLMISNNDDLSFFNRPSTDAAIQQCRHDASSSHVYRAWKRIYKGIANANSYMKAIENSEFDKEHILYNEARFLRAYYHFILAQAWGDVPLRTEEVTKKDQTSIAATPQLEVLKWSLNEMKEILASGCVMEDVEAQPSRVTKTTIQGIIARVALFTAGVEGVEDPKPYLKEAMEQTKAVIASGKHSLNPDYKDIFINMISDKYDTRYHESMWEVEFLGDRSTAASWSNGRIGDLLGLQSSGSHNFSEFNCNFSYAQYDGSIKLWDLYYAEDRTEDEQNLPNVTDVRQDWNLPPFNYRGHSKRAPYGVLGAGSSRPSIDKTVYEYDNVTTTEDPLVLPGGRNCGKFRRETKYEGVMTSKSLYTTINYPLLRYADVLLMYAEAQNEYEGTPSQEAYDCVKAVRDRAKIKTFDFGDYDFDSFRRLVRNERGRELCFESLRRYDLIRWGTYVHDMNEAKVYARDSRWSKSVKAKYAAIIGSNVQHRHRFLPIPNVELGVNKKLSQNPEW